jgi:hypothetical protein
VFLDDFLEKITPSKKDVKLKQEGKKWRYILPKYPQQQIHEIKTIISKHFFELGIIKTGILNNKECFKITDFGKRLFEN